MVVRKRELGITEAVTRMLRKHSLRKSRYASWACEALALGKWGGGIVLFEGFALTVNHESSSLLLH